MTIGAVVALLAIMALIAAVLGIELFIGGKILDLLTRCVRILRNLMTPKG